MRRLLSRPPPAALLELGANLRFEIAVGMNGRVWLDAPTHAVVSVVQRVLDAIETRAGDEAATVRLARTLAEGVKADLSGDEDHDIPGA